MRRRRLEALRCPRGHLGLHPDPACALCGAPLRAVHIAPEAVLELVTTVHVNPSGRPFALGVAVTRAGRVRTLCRVEGAVRGTGNDAVVLERHGDMIVARPRPAIRAHNPARRATRRCGRRY